ncbi:MAG: hypothetical protein M1834_001078 [Cirrosporium novae-zelandiae]|nr:MAG: hypothetical protein M1834_001078 [Cirrosporium novae-zelandiae]
MPTLEMALQRGNDSSTPIYELVTGPEMVNVFVGGRKHFYVHKRLLLERGGPFFEAILNRLRQSIVNIIQLPDEEPTTFGLFLLWLFGSPLPRPLTYQACLDLSYLWIFANKICITDLKDAAIDEIVDGYWHIRTKKKNSDCMLPKMKDVAEIHRKTNDSSQLRRLYFDIVVYNAAFIATREDFDQEKTLKDIFRYGGDLPADLALKFIQAFSSRENNPLEWPRSGRYHEHRTLPR